MAFVRQGRARHAQRASFITGAAALAALALPVLLARIASGADDPSVSRQMTGESPPTAGAADSDRRAVQRELEREEARIRALERRLSQDEAAVRKDQGSARGSSQGSGNEAAVTASGQSASGPEGPPAASSGETSDSGALSGSFGSEGFTLQSADGQNVIHLRGNLSLDYRYFDDSYTPVTADTFLVRKARPTLEGTLDGVFDFRLMPDFAQGKTILQDAWVDAPVKSWLVFQIGKFKAPVGLERLQLEEFARFIEASLTSDLLPYRDLGFEVRGSIANGLLTYQAGVFDGAPDGQSTESNSTPDFNSTGKFVWDGRVFAHPFQWSDRDALKGLGIGVAGTYVNASGKTSMTSTTSLLAAYKTTGQQSLFSYRSDTATGFNNATIANGIERRWVPQANYYVGPFGLLAEYVWADQQVFRQLSTTSSRSATLDNRAWQVQAYLFLTGEKETYDQVVVPRRSVSHGGIGAWEIVARYHDLRFDDAAFAGGANSFANPATAARDARAVGVGVNWYLSENFRLELDYEQTRFEAGAATGNRPDERVLTSQFMLAF